MKLVGSKGPWALGRSCGFHGVAQASETFGSWIPSAPISSAEGKARSPTIAQMGQMRGDASQPRPGAQSYNGQAETFFLAVPCEAWRAGAVVALSTVFDSSSMVMLIAEAFHVSWSSEA